MQFRIISFTVAIAVLSAMSACGPNKKRGNALDEAQKKAAAAAGPKGETLEKVILNQDLPHLADGKALWHSSCANTVNMEMPASEKEVTAEAREILAEGSVFELVSATVHGESRLKTGETGTITGTVAGPLAISDKRTDNDSAAKVTCHTGVVETAKDKLVAPTEVALTIPAQIVAKTGQSSAMATLNLQARNGKVGGRVTLQPVPANVEALLAQTAADTTDAKSSLTSDTDQRLHYRLQQTISKDGDTTIFTIEAIYAKK